MYSQTVAKRAERNEIKSNLRTLRVTSLTAFSSHQEISFAVNRSRARGARIGERDGQEISKVAAAAVGAVVTRRKKFVTGLCSLAAIPSRNEHRRARKDNRGWQVLEKYLLRLEATTRWDRMTGDKESRRDRKLKGREGVFIAGA